MTPPQAVDGEDHLQMWRVAVSVLNDQSWTADNGWWATGWKFLTAKK